MGIAVDAHRLAEERSLAYHQVIAERMACDANILLRARARVETWTDSADPVPHYASQWREILQRPLPAIVAFLSERSQLADELRQSTPFAGVLSPRERWAIWANTGERLRGVA